MSHAPGARRYPAARASGPCATAGLSQGSRVSNRRGAAHHTARPVRRSPAPTIAPPDNGDRTHTRAASWGNYSPTAWQTARISGSDVCAETPCGRGLFVKDHRWGAGRCGCANAIRTEARDGTAGTRGRAENLWLDATRRSVVGRKRPATGAGPRYDWPQSGAERGGRRLLGTSGSRAAAGPAPAARSDP